MDAEYTMTDQLLKPIGSNNSFILAARILLLVFP